MYLQIYHGICSVVWSSHYVKDKVLLERVQHQFSRMCPELIESLAYRMRNDFLNLACEVVTMHKPSLERRN